MLTEKEEKSFVKYLLNRNRCRQGVTEKEGEGIVLNILCTREAVNKKGGRKFVGAKIVMSLPKKIGSM